MNNSAGSKWISKKNGYQNNNTGAIQNWNARRLISVSFSLLVVFLVSVLVGSHGPQVFRENTSMKQSHKLAQFSIVHHASGEAKFEVSGYNFTVDSLSNTNQMLYAQIELEPPPMLKEKGGAIEELTFTQQMFVSVRGYDSKSMISSQKASRDIGGWGNFHGSSEKVLLENMEHNRTIVCSRGKPLCSPTQVFFEHFVEFSNYHVQIKFVHDGLLYDTSYDAQVSVVFVSGTYTDFEMYFKAVFAVMSGLVAIFYFTRLRKQYPNSRCGLCGCLGSIWKWTWQQRWVALLLVLLVLFNDPLFALSVYSNAHTSEITTGIYMISSAAFVCTLLCFWLAILTVAGRTDEYSGGGGRSANKLTNLVAKAEETFFPHCVLCGIIFICAVAVNFYERLHSVSDPSFSTLEDIPNTHYRSLFLGGTVLTAMYSVWLLLLVGQCCREMCTMAPAFRFLFVLTVATIAVVLAGLYQEALSPLPSAAVSFLCFYTACNLYVWTLAAAFAPSLSSASGETAQGEHGMHVHSMDGAEHDVESQQPNSNSNSNSSSSRNSNPVGMEVLQTSIQTSVFGNSNGNNGHVQLAEQQNQVDTI